MKKVTVYSSSMGNKSFETSATTFNGLVLAMMENSIRYNSGEMKAVIGQTKVTLEHEDAIIPDGDFTLFLLPIKTKSGSRDRATCYSIIMDFRKDPVRGEEAQKFFRNFTTTSNEGLNLLIDVFSVMEEEKVEENTASQKDEDFESVLDNLKKRVTELEEFLRDEMDYVIPFPYTEGDGESNSLESEFFKLQRELL